MASLRVVKLYGELGKRFGRVHRFAIRTPAEAIRALTVNFPGFEKHLIDSGARGVGYRVGIGREDLGLDELHNPAGRESIRIVPAISGSGDVGKILVGAALVTAAVLLTPATGGGSLALLGKVGMAVGVNLALNGVAGILTPNPKVTAPQESESNRPSYLFNGPVNTTQQGQPVALCYGSLIVGSAVVSAGTSTEQLGSGYFGWFEIEPFTIGL